METLDLIATCAFGLESIVRRELESLGYSCRIRSTGAVEFVGDSAAIGRSNLWLRCADRILIKISEFTADDFGKLFDGAFAAPWQRWMPPSAGLYIRGRSLRSQLSSVPACQRIVHKAVAEKLKKAHDVESLPEDGPRFTIEVAIKNDVAMLTLDTTGASLHKRGYRTLTGAAPLKETLAAALVQLSFWRPDRPLADPFCGTGTIPIEAALLGLNIAPGLNRPFAAEEWPTLDGSLWQDARSEARDLQKNELALPIIGADIDAGAIRMARIHAANAGVAEYIHFQQKAFSTLESKKVFGCLITNPPYGERLGEKEEIDCLYREFPIVLRGLKTWSHYILTANSDMERLVGRPADRRRKLYNGRLECTYYQFHGPKPTFDRTSEADVATDSPSGDDVFSNDVPGDKKTPARSQRPIRVATPVGNPAFGGLNEKAHEQAGLFRARLAKRARHMRRWPQKFDITCYRLYERDIPEIPLIVDRYEDCLHISEYERPHDRGPAEHADWLDLMKKTAGTLLDIPPQKTFFKHRAFQQGDSQHPRVAQQQQHFVVQEGGLKFRVNLSDYIDTGLFLDHRITRDMVREESHKKRFLNLFGYTGAFTVYAADGNASETTTVDLSQNYLDWAADNIELNGLTDKRHRFVPSDAVQFIFQHPVRPSYDLAVVDPPTFSNSKKTDTVWDVQRGYVDLLNRLLKLMTPGGIIFFSTNFRRFKFDESLIRGVTVREISRKTVPPDFRNRRIHRCWRLVKIAQ